MAFNTTGLAFLGPDTPLTSAYGDACLVARTKFPVLTFLTAIFCTFVLGVAFGVLIMLRYPMFHRNAHPPLISDQLDGGVAVR